MGNFDKIFETISKIYLNVDLGSRSEYLFNKSGKKFNLRTFI